MSSGLVGGLAGLGLGAVDYVVFGWLIDRMRRAGGRDGAVKGLEIARVAQLVAFPAIGYWIGATQF